MGGSKFDEVLQRAESLIHNYETQPYEQKHEALQLRSRATSAARRLPITAPLKPPELRPAAAQPPVASTLVLESACTPTFSSLVLRGSNPSTRVVVKASPEANSAESTILLRSTDDITDLLGSLELENSLLRKQISRCLLPNDHGSRLQDDVVHPRLKKEWPSWPDGQRPLQPAAGSAQTLPAPPPTLQPPSKPVVPAKDMQLPWPAPGWPTQPHAPESMQLDTAANQTLPVQQHEPSCQPEKHRHHRDVHVAQGSAMQVQ